MCKIFGYCCSLILYAAASVGLFYAKVYTDCEGTWDCEPSTCEEKYMWYDLWGCFMFFAPVISVLNMTNCGFTWWKFGSFGIALTITICQILSIVGCCCTRKRNKGKGDDKESKKKKKKKKSDDEDDKSKPFNTDVAV